MSDGIGNRKAATWAAVVLISDDNLHNLPPQTFRDGQVGFVPTILEQAAPSAANTIALVCGPPIMIKFTLPVLEKLGFNDEQIYTTLENRMKCGLGKCGRCNVGNVYVCKDGPVFTAGQVKTMPQEF